MKCAAVSPDSPLLTKIMLSTSVAITVLFAITGQIVLRHITGSVSDSLEEEVQSSFHSYVSLWNARAELLSAVSRMMASMPDVRLAFGTRDQATIRDTASELWSRISASDAIFLVTDPARQSDRVAERRGPLAFAKQLDFVQQAPRHVSRAILRLLSWKGELYHLSVTPVYVHSARGRTALLNVLVAGDPGGRDGGAGLEGSDRIASFCS